MGKSFGSPWTRRPGLASWLPTTASRRNQGRLSPPQGRMKTHRRPGGACGGLLGSPVRSLVRSAVSRPAVRSDADVAGPASADCAHARTANRSLVGCFVIINFPRRGDCIRSLSRSAGRVHGPDRGTAPRIVYTELRYEPPCLFTQVLRSI